jgi:hypothetical protein
VTTAEAYDHAKRLGLQAWRDEAEDWGATVACPFCRADRKTQLVKLRDDEIDGLDGFCNTCFRYGAEIGERLAELAVNGNGHVPPPAGEKRLRLRPFSDVKRRNVELLPGELAIPFGTVTVLAAMQGTGKGLYGARQAATLTQLGFGVIVLSDEDSAAATIKPRLQAAGADVSKAYFPEVERRDDLGGIYLVKDTAELGEIAGDVNAALLLIDPWTNYVEADHIDTGRAREALMPLKEICEEHRLVVSLSAHTNRRGLDEEPLNRIAHSGAVTQISRSAFWMCEDPEWEGDGHTPYRLVAHIKHNLTPRHATARFKIRGVDLPAVGDEPALADIGVMEYEGRSMLTYAGICQVLRDLARSEKDTKLNACAEMLREMLRSGPQLKSACVVLGESNGYPQRTVERAAAERLKVRVRRSTQGAIWELPA